ncbi:hypothetical protein [uncultured Alistipes sp.]|uniref:hypothetical protein n=1 Tax=uncultured Alistipes sp. TaxID=538949 RepID=UPI00261F9991|nr:hypothetical protein [uncultured Alistipes sp.]
MMPLCPAAGFCPEEWMLDGIGQSGDRMELPVRYIKRYTVHGSGFLPTRDTFVTDLKLRISIFAAVWRDSGILNCNPCKTLFCRIFGAETA